VAILHGSPPNLRRAEHRIRQMSAGDRQRPNTGSMPPHPVRIEICEALGSIEEPMSASLLHEVLGGDLSFETVAYHVLRLAKDGVLTERDPVRVSGATEHPYVLAP
jgi:hypothetical protein